LLAIAVPGVVTLALLLTLAVIVVFLVWIYRARHNAGRSRAHHRRSRGWAIGSWFVPVVNLWFPLQVVQDIWRADVEPAQRVRMPWLVGTWWACWLLAWFTGAHETHTTVVGGDGNTHVNTAFSLFLDSTIVSKLFTAAAAILLALVVRDITSRQTARDTLTS
jgi:hypothetical protein